MIIRRTLVYAALTAILGLFYFGSVILLQRAFVIIAGQASPVAVFISTLAIAALFSPLRRRLQQGIDQRFFRQHYNTQKILDAFASGIRDEVDIESLSSRLLDTVNKTVQPQQINLWLWAGK